jgi:hypothetical protein
MMNSSALQTISNEYGKTISVIVPIELWKIIKWPEKNTLPPIQQSEWNTLDEKVSQSSQTLDAFLQTEVAKLNKAEEKAMAEEGMEDYVHLTGGIIFILNCGAIHAGASSLYSHAGASMPLS